jgi:hypothetical protein
VYLVAIAAVGLFPTRLWACSCRIEPTPSLAFQNDAVFVGKAVKVSRWADFPLLKQSVRLWRALSGSRPGSAYYKKTQATAITFDVRESWKGVTTGQVTVEQSAGTCAFEFNPGDEYLVYASRVDGAFRTSVCTRTSRVGAAEEDLAFLRLLPTLTLTPAVSVTPYVVAAILAIIGLIAAAWFLRRRNSGTGGNSGNPTDSRFPIPNSHPK